jgi:hypothetical protein
MEGVHDREVDLHEEMWFKSGQGVLPVEIEAGGHRRLKSEVGAPWLKLEAGAPPVVFRG